MSESHSHFQRRLLLKEKNFMNMTKAWKYIAKGKDVKNFNEKFPTHGKEYERKQMKYIPDCLPTSMDNPAFSPGDSLGRKKIPADNHIERKRKNLFLSRESLRSSTASIPEVIEECSSDDESSEETSVDYMNCINCALSKSTSSLDSTVSDPFIKQGMTSCYRCRHLSATKDKLSIPNIYIRLNRPLSWSAGDMSVNSPQRLRRSGLSVSSELPSISESCDESETEEDYEATSEFHKSNSTLRRSTIANDNDVKTFRKLKKFKSVRKNCDFT